MRSLTTFFCLVTLWASTALAEPYSLHAWDLTDSGSARLFKVWFGDGKTLASPSRFPLCTADSVDPAGKAYAGDAVPASVKVAFNSTGEATTAGGRWP
jgi:hypothetical protein